MQNKVNTASDKLFHEELINRGIMKTLFDRFFTIFENQISKNVS